ncbi:MAG TPA: hypothetical protein VLN74_00445 [Ilumatobacteraceae bacterium]|nr:hypothetical protein [Ilumatobacteraceae bacterium]
MNLGIIVPLVVLPIALVGAYLWYRRSLADMRPAEAKPVSGLRLTSEALHRVPSPPWRVVYEIGGALGGVDHVVVGPPGVTAITTVVADRPDPEQLRSARGDAQLVGDAAIARGPLDELLRPIGSSCDRSARVYWGVPDPGRPPADDLVHASQLVEGQRLAEWLATIGQVERAEQTTLDQAGIDLVWRTITIGIGRPDPLP